MSIIADDNDFKSISEKKKNSVIKAETIELDSDKNFENCIRPKSFDTYIGQSALKETLQISIEAAKKRELPLDHLLFYGPPGLGKTTLAGVIAEQMGVEIKITSAPALTRSFAQIYIDWCYNKSRRTFRTAARPFRNNSQT